MSTGQPSTGTLPTPQDRPSAEVVIYDGNCQFCTRQVQRLHAWDWQGRLAFVSLHDPDIGRYARDLTHDQLMEQMYVVDRSGRQYGGAAAFRYLSCKLPLLWPVAPLMHIPGSLPLWRWLYAQIASRRYRWNARSCDNGACRVHIR